MNTATYADIVQWDDDSPLKWRREASAELDRDPGNQPLRRLYAAHREDGSGTIRAAAPALLLDAVKDDAASRPFTAGNPA